MTQTNSDLQQARDTAMRLTAWGPVAMVPVIALAALMTGNAVLPVTLFAALIAAIAMAGARSIGGATGRQLVGFGLIGSAMGFTAAFAGHPWQIDTHMLFFAMLAVSMAMADRNVIIVCTVATALHHLGSVLVLPALVFPSVDLGGNLERVVLHAVILLIEAAVLYGAILQREALDQAKARADAEARDLAQRDRQRSEDLARLRQAVVSGLSTALNRLAKRDLSVTIDQPFDEAHESLRRNFNDAISELRDTVQQVIRNARAVSEDADAIANASNNLAQRTERQASSLQDTANAIQEINSNVRASAQAAKSASSVADQAQARTAASDEVLQRTMKAMAAIENSSAEISNIIQVIDEIAFQTNLLALNAGVEAARAGEAGRGFSVVATEVRALAARSSKSAREINELIQTSSAQVQTGVNLVNETGEALRKISESVSDVAALVSQIASSSNEQSASIALIDERMKELDQVTQQNAAMFEETNAASSALNREAEELSTLMLRFQTGESVTGFGSGGVGFFEPRPQAAPRSAPAPRAQAARMAVNAPPPAPSDDWDEF